MALSPVPEARVRLVFFGAAGVGKTALIRRFLQDAFETRHRRTVEELHLLELELEAGSGLRLRLEIMDTSGSYSFPAMRRLCIGRGDAFALVYSLQEPDSFAEAQRLRDEILEAKRGPAPIVLVGNKSDLEPGEPDPRIAAAAAQRDWGCTCLETSAKQGRNVAGLFQELLSQVNLPGRLSPALRRRRPQPCSKEPPHPPGKSPSCVIC